MNKNHWKLTTGIITSLFLSIKSATIFDNLPKVNKILEVKKESVTEFLDDTPITDYYSILSGKIKVS